MLHLNRVSTAKSGSGQQWEYVRPTLQPKNHRHLTHSPCIFFLNRANPVSTIPICVHSYCCNTYHTDTFLEILGCDNKQANASQSANFAISVDINITSLNNHLWFSEFSLNSKYSLFRYQWQTDIKPHAWSSSHHSWEERKGQTYQTSANKQCHPFMTIPFV